MNEQQLRDHIGAINTGLRAVAQLPTTSRLSELQQECQSVRNAEAQISELLEEGKMVVMDKNNLTQELVLNKAQGARLEAKATVCSHGDLVEEVRNLEGKIVAQASGQMETDTAQELENAQAQLENFSNLAEEYRGQVTQILKLTEGSQTAAPEEREHDKRGNQIARFSAEDTKVLRGWKMQLALNIAGKPKAFNTEQQKLRYAIGHLEQISLAQCVTYCHEASREVKLNYLKVIMEMVDLTFGDQDKAATAKWEFLKLKLRDREFSNTSRSFRNMLLTSSGTSKHKWTLYEMTCPTNSMSS